MRNLILICCLVFAKAGFSQTTLSHQVIGSLGNTETVGNIVIEQSLGDLVIVSSNVGDDVASGFQQGRKYIDYIYESSNWRPFAPESNATFIDNFFIKSDGAILGSAIDIKDITIEGAYTVDLGSFDLSFKGDLSSQNSKISNGSLQFLGDDGESNRLFSSNIEIEEFVLNSNDTFNLDQPMQITDLFTLKDGVIDVNDGNLVFLSNAIKTAEIAPYEGGSMQGEVQVQRFIPAKRAFRFLTSSVNTSGTTLENWQENGASASGFGTHITGSTIGANGFDATATGNPSMFEFDNIAQTWMTVSNTDIDGLDVGTPYRVMIRGDRMTDLTTSSAVPSPTVLRSKGTMDLNGYMNNGLSQVAGDFNFIANPYQATVNMNTVLQGSNNLNANHYYVWDPTINSRGAYVTVLLPAGNNIAGSAANEYVQPAQAAFVTTLNNTTAVSPTAIEFNQADIVNGNQTLTFSTPNVDFSIVGKLQRNINGQSNIFLDAWGIFMNGQYSSALDHYDAVTIGNLDETVSVDSGSNLLNIEYRDVPVNMDIIPLNVYNYRHNSYNYQIDVEAVPAGTNVFLKDNYLNIDVALVEGINHYPFTIDNSIASSQANRFHLFFTNTTLSEDPIDPLTGFEFYPNPVDDVLNISWNNFNSNDENDFKYRLINTLGQIIRTGTLDFSGNVATITDLGRLASGSYYIELDHNGSAKTVQVIKK